MEKPRLKQGETPQSPSYVKRLKEYNRAVALAEATAMQKEQNEQEAADRAKRNVLKEAKTQAGPKSKQQTSSKPKTGLTAGKTKTSNGERKKGVAATFDTLKNRSRTIDEAVDGAVEMANYDNKRKKK